MFLQFLNGQNSPKTNFDVTDYSRLLHQNGGRATQAQDAICRRARVTSLLHFKVPYVVCIGLDQDFSFDFVPSVYAPQHCIIFMSD